MTSVTIQSELMTQTVAAATISTDGIFFVVQDSQYHPMVFSIGDGGVLYLILQGPLGHNTLINLSTGFKIPSTSKVTALAVTQGINGTIWLVFSEHIGGGTNDKLYVVSPVDPANFDWTTPDLTSQLLQDRSSQNTNVSQDVVSVTRFFLGSDDSTSSYPILIVEYTTPLNTQDITPISVSQGGWTYPGSFVLPENASVGQMTALSAASIKGYNGLFCLYTVSGAQHITFVAPEPDSDDAILETRGVEGVRADGQIQVIHDVTSLDVLCISSFVDNTNNTAVAFGAADGLYYFPAMEAGRKTGQSQQLSSDPLFAKVQELYVSRTDSVVSFWATNPNNQIVYQQFDAKTMQPITKAVALLPSNSGGRFAPLDRPDQLLLQLFVLSSDGTIVMLQQSQVSQLWQTAPYLIPSTGKNFDYVSFTTHLEFVDKDNVPLCSTSSKPINLRLSCNGVLSVTCNGAVHLLTPAGIDVSLDMSGTLTVISPTQDISTPVLHISDVPGASVTYLGGKEILIDPASKISEKIATIKDVQSLQAAAGDAIPAGTSQDTLDKASSAISQVHSISQQLTQASTKRLSLESKKEKAVDSILDDIWDAFYAIENGLKAVVSFVIDTAEEVAYLAITVADGVLKFVLTTVEYCFKAISWVLTNVLHIDLSALVKWLGFIFGWEDILDTQTIVAAGLNKAFDLTQQMIPQWVNQADAWLTSLETQIETSLTKALPQNIANTSTSSSGLNTAANSNSSTNGARSSPGANWLNYNLKHGSAGQSLSKSIQTQTSKLESKNLTGGDPAQDLLKVFSDALSTMGEVLKGFFSGIYSLFQGDFTLENVISGLIRTLKTIVKDTFDGMKSIVTDGGALFVDLLSSIQDIANAALPEIPLLSQLWVFLCRDKPLSLLNVLSLLIALPATIITKIITGNPPSAFPEYKELQQLLSPKQNLLVNELDMQEIVSASLGSALGSIFGCLSGVARLGIPFGTVVGVIFSVIDWYKPDVATSKGELAFAFVLAGLSFPADAFTSNPIRPVISMRVWECAMNLFQAASLEEKIKTDRAAFLLGFIAIKGIPIVVSVIEDFCADKTQYPALDYGTLWAFETNRLISWVAELANASALAERGVNEPVDGAFVILSYISFSLGLYNVGESTSKNTYQQAANAPPSCPPV